MAQRETKANRKDTRAGWRTLLSVSPALIVVLALASGLVAGCKASSLLEDVKARVAETAAGATAAIAAPVFSPSAGTYASDQSVTITSATQGATIRYTVSDGATGTAPTASSTEYIAAIPITGNGTTKTIEAIAVKEGMSSSQVAVATYVIRYDQVAKPTISPSTGSYSSDQSVVIDCSTQGATIHYTVADGATGSTPTAASPVYTSPIPLAGDGTVKTVRAIAVKPGLADSEIASSTITINYSQVSTPQFSPQGGTSSSDITVSISDSTGGATIYYTTDGKAPTTASNLYSSPIAVSGDGTSVTIKAIAVAAGMIDSDVATATFVINYSQVSTPELIPVAGTYTSDQLVSITDTTPGATIHYTTNGSPPTSSSPAYSTQISVSGDGVTMTIRAIATLAGMNDSTEVSGTYTIQYPHTVFFDAQGGSTASPTSKSVVYNQQYGTLATTSRTGYTFNGWWTGAGGTGTHITAASVATFAGNQTLYAAWNANTYTVRFYSPDGSAPNPSTKTVTYDQLYGSLATTSRTGYTLDGWFTGTGGTGTKITSGTTVKITTTQNLYAAWTANTYTVSFNSQQGTTPVPTSKTVTYESTYGALADTSRLGYSFLGWWTGAGGSGSHITSSTKVTTTVDQTLYAAWSPAGSTWSPRTLPSSGDWSSVAYGNGVFVAVDHGSSNVAATSPDGTTWTKRTLPASAMWSSVIYANGLFVAIATGPSNVAATSPDGVTWTKRTLPSSEYWTEVTYGNGLFVAISTQSMAVATSTNGTSWTGHQALPGALNWTSVAYGGGYFVAVATGTSQGAYSSDGVNWQKSLLPSSESWTSVTYSGSQFVALAANSSTRTLATSSNGSSWTGHSYSLPSVQWWSEVIYGNGVYIATAYGSDAAAISSDGTTWTPSTLPSSQNWSGLAYGNGVFVAVAQGPTTAAATSP